MIWIAAVVCMVGIMTMAVGDLLEDLRLMVFGGVVAMAGFLYVVLGVL